MNSKIPAPELSEAISSMKAVSLADLDNIRLLNRMDAKFVFHLRQLPALLNALSADYPLLEIQGRRVFRYENVYFDSPEFFLYHMHQRGMAKRFKVRTRTYADTGLRFFEVKTKTAANRTLKTRTLMPDLSLLPKALGEISWGRHSPLKLSAVMNIGFDRITLAGFHPPERITLDLNLCFKNASRELNFPDLVIAELKQEKSRGVSPFLTQLRKIHLEEIGFSKYAMSVALLEKVKYNAFKPVVLKLNRLLHADQEIKPGLLL